MKRNIDNLSEKEIEEEIDNLIIYEQRELDVKKKYHSEFKKVLSNKKIALLYKSEIQFKTELLKRLKNTRGKPNQNKKR